MRTYHLLALLLVFCFSTLRGQNLDFQDLVRAGANDGSKYMENYMEPAMISFANGLAGGWMNTAKNHKLLGVDLTFTLNLATIPSDLHTFNFRNADYEAFELNSGASEAQLPTFGGGSTDEMLRIPVNTTIDINGVPYTFQEEVIFNAIGGVGDDIPLAVAAPAPALQLGVGLVKNTDVKIRYMPTISTGDFEMNLFGIGIMHDIKQWIPGLKLVPIDLVGFFGTTKLSTTVNIPDVNDTDFAISNGSTEMEISATTLQVMVSKKLAFFTPYAGVGYNFTRASLDLKGDYTFKDPNGIEADQTLSNPFALDFDGGNSPRVTFGAQVKLLVLTFHADYTIQKYNTLSLGLGISVR